MLGKLSKRDLRDVWKHEALDFTKWLAQSENIAFLAQEIGIDLQVLNTEASVGSFSVDILAEELHTGKKVIIENQLEMTNHDHLGKIITYASGIEANYVIWIFKDIRDEHRRAIDWLNEVTSGEVNFFAIQMELWVIDNSPPAPKFNIISSPNNWANAVRSSKGGSELSDNNLFQIEFWKGLNDYLVSAKSSLHPQKAKAQHWCNCAIGSSQAVISLIVSVKDSFIRSDFYIYRNKDLFFSLLERKDEIESKLGFEMDWQELPDAKAARISLKKEISDIKNESNRKAVYQWYRENGEKIQKVFKDYL
ncbi:MAG: DUF4268 domain-containing protein [Sphingobacteriia bacterium]|nr:DUF4268 domain-containing protein [Sphingobacteriia bacterium]